MPSGLKLKTKGWLSWKINQWSVMQNSCIVVDLQFYWNIYLMKTSPFRKVEIFVDIKAIFKAILFIGILFSKLLWIWFVLKRSLLEYCKQNAFVCLLHVWKICFLSCILVKRKYFFFHDVAVVVFCPFYIFSQSNVQL